MLVAPLEQLRNRYERLGLTIRFECNLIASRFVGVCALHMNAGTIRPGGCDCLVRKLYLVEDGAVACWRCAAELSALAENPASFTYPLPTSQLDGIRTNDNANGDS